MTSQIKDEEDDLHFSEAGKTFYKIRFRRASPVDRIHRTE